MSCHTLKKKKHQHSKMTDPWLVREKQIKNKSSDNSKLEENSTKEISNILETKTSLEFEDNFLSSQIAVFATNSKHNRLPDSEDYLQSLEKKLNKLKKNPKILEALSEKRAECLRNLLDDNIFINKDETLELDTPVSSGDSAVQELYRHIQPVQPLSVGETVHIVKYDQLENSTEELEQEAQEDSNSESYSR